MMFDVPMKNMWDYHATRGRGYQTVELGGEPGDLFAVNDLLSRRVRIFRQSQIVEVLASESGYSVELKSGESVRTQDRPVAATIEPDDADPADSLATLLMVRKLAGGSEYLRVEDVARIASGQDTKDGLFYGVVYGKDDEVVISSEPPEVLAARLDRLRRGQKAEAR